MAHHSFQVSEMMGSELHLHVLTASGDKIYVTCEGKVMHFFDTENQKNLLV